jgi:thymidine phosphorylase
VQHVATRDIGLAVIELGGGRRRAGDAVDPRVGFSEVVGLGQRVERGEPLAWVHAADADAARAASARLAGSIELGEVRPPSAPVLVQRL